MPDRRRAARTTRETVLTIAQPHEKTAAGAGLDTGAGGAAPVFLEDLDMRPLVSRGRWTKRGMRHLPWLLATGGRVQNE